MADQKNTQSNWTGSQAYVLAIICLVAGIAIGYLVRGSASPAVAHDHGTEASSGMPTGVNPGMEGMQQPSPEQMRRMAEKQAEPLLAQLKSNPNDAKLLYNIGNIYYDTQQYPEAIKYYEQSLKIDPKSSDVRTDMATAYFYSDQPDRALAEIETVLKSDPKHANALFNKGMYLWRGKMDINGAVAAWKELLKTNPNYAHRDEVQNFIAQAEKHANIKPGQKTNKPAMN
ncbi:MAG TPA: tetratricopeptide repeat protein [Terriglobales bacterium]|nr:tetratricopeptide repeat protein [Terriglobales bacterium]